MENIKQTEGITSENERLSAQVEQLQVGMKDNKKLYEYFFLCFYVYLILARECDAETTTPEPRNSATNSGY